MTTYTTSDNPAIPEGMYIATFQGIETITGQWGERLQWRFQIQDGDYAEKTTSAFSGKDNPTIKSNLCKFLCSLLGKPPQAGIECDPDAFVNQPYRIAVGETESGSTKVISFRPVEAKTTDEPAMAKTTDLAADNIPF